MATKKTSLGKAKAIVKKINNDLIDTSFNAIESSVKAGEKWQKLTSKLIKKAEPLTKQQINMVVETAESIKGQLENSTHRLKTLVGYNPKVVENAKKRVSEHPLVEKAEKIKENVQKEVSNHPIVKKAEKMSNKLKKDITETIKDVKNKIDIYTENTEKKADKTTAKPKTTTAKKTVAKKKPVTKKPVAKSEKVLEENTELLNETKEKPKETENK